MSDTPSIPQKRCSQCHIEKPIYEFHKHSREKDGYRRNCKQCRSDNGEFNYRKPAPPGYKWCRRCDTLYEATTEFFYWNSTHNRLYASCKKCHNDRSMDWVRHNYDVHLALTRRWMQSHPEEMRRYTLKWRLKNPEVYAGLKEQGIAELREIERNMSPEKRQILKKFNKAKRRAIEIQAEGSHTHEDLLLLYDEQHGLCAYCGIRVFWGIPNDLHVEHIKPLSRGGSNWIDNICLACRDCNLSKMDKSPNEWELVRGW